MLFYFTGELARGGSASWLQQNNFSWHRGRPTRTSRSRGKDTVIAAPPPPSPSGIQIRWQPVFLVRIRINLALPETITNRRRKYRKYHIFSPWFWYLTLQKVLVQFTYCAFFIKFSFQIGTLPQGLQRDVYLGWPIAPSYMGPNAGGGGQLRGLSHWVQLYTGAQINFGDLTPSFTYAYRYWTATMR